MRVELETNEDLETCGPLWLTSHGKRLQLGSFLGPDQLQTLAGELKPRLPVPGDQFFPTQRRKRVDGPASAP